MTLFFGSEDPFLLQHILSFAAPKTNLSLEKVDKALWDTYQNNPLLWEKTGAKNRDDFITRASQLPQELQKLVLEGVYNLPLAEDIFRAVPKNAPFIAASFLSDDNGIQAVKEGLIKPEQIFQLKTNLGQLLSDNGLQALREKLMTPEQFIILPSGPHCKILLSDNGLQALKDGFITPEKARGMSEDELHDYIETSVCSSGPACS
ncbi:hypothetical protein [Legionella spiritensis]|uniref:Uncharacterized protein n=1 Tax=Legionella spiritensis TaxID=452 RepID=A0A0W0Z8D0_LEGSP|nr:hypothetical protein [Legionella spiritensis]KTD65372.1 hypothetical protein Lspi_0689 [Legionella spiritensis]SNV47206.1 Uncharacterised protein [Legionella spiritensis]